MRYVSAAALLAGILLGACAGPSWSTLQGTVTANLCPLQPLPVTASLAPSSPASGSCAKAGVPGINVLAVSQSDGSLHLAKTDSHGRYSMSVPAGEYFLYLGFTSRPPASAIAAARARLSGFPGERALADISVHQPPVMVPLVPSG